MGTRSHGGVRVLLTGLIMFGGLSVVSLVATTALTTGPASAGPATLFSSATVGYLHGAGSGWGHQRHHHRDWRNWWS
jgi:hypothetical protein